MAELMFEKGFLKGRSIKVPEGRFLIVGRAKEAGLPLPDPQLSRRHCKITHTLEGILFEDLGSRNGTYVNGKPITTVKLKHGDEIVFGDQTARYLNPEEMGDSSGEFESEEAEATREIPILEPGQAMLLNPPNIVRGPDSKPATQAPVQLPPPGVVSMGILGQSGGVLPNEGVPVEDLDAQLPRIDQGMPMTPDLVESIDADLSAPLPDLPKNTISMEETMVQPRKNADSAKPVAPASKIKKLMDSYKAEVMASKKDDIKAVPKARPATSLRPQTGDDTDLRLPDPAAAKPAAPPTVAAGSKSAAPAAPAGATPATADAAWENENRIEEFIEAADETLSPTADANGSNAGGKTIPLPAERTRGAKAGQELRDLADALLEADLAEEHQQIDAKEPADQRAGPLADISELEDDEADPDDHPFQREPKPDETGTIDPATIAGINDEIVIDSSRIDRHREIADEIFRAAQAPGAGEAEEAEVIQEVDEDFDLDSLEPVAAPTLDLGQLDRSENTAESATGIEVLDGGNAEPGDAGTATPTPPAERPQPAATTMGRQITPMPTLPPIVADEHVASIGVNELYSYCDALFEEKPRARAGSERNLLAPILTKNEEYSGSGQ